MNIKSRLRNTLVRKIQRLSTEKLTELSNLLGKIESQIQSKEKTLKLAGSWKNLDDDFFENLTKNLHETRSKDRQLN
jgi:hypothetical protein